MKKIILLLLCVFCLGAIHYAYSEDNPQLGLLKKQVIEAKTNEDAFAALEVVKEVYFKDDKYSGFVDLLNSLMQEKKSLEPLLDYYIGLARYSQLKFLEEKQLWDEYFSQGNTYRQQIEESLQKAISASGAKDPLTVYSRLILWQFHRDQQDVFHEQALTDLMNAALEYAKDAKDITPVKVAADKLLSYGEKAKSKQLYKIYVDKIATSDRKDEELAGIALDFYKKGNLDLSELVYDIYMQRAQKSLPKEKLIPFLSDIAKMFSVTNEGLKDPAYAESVFKRIEEAGGKDAFDEELLYLRAFNLEKAKELVKAKENYAELVKKFPQTAHADEANFKVGIIFAYILKDQASALQYFEKLGAKDAASPQSISALYQLGLLSQWNNKLDEAKQYYAKLIEKAKTDFQDTVGLARERLKEVEGNSPIEYNLKTFLDVSFKEDYAQLDTTKLALQSSFSRLKIDQATNISSSVYTGETGCMQVALQYLWSGDLGKA
ncbi:MAG: tetratricopeptide repeat protein, partial [Candidatus Omnitrophica bacterium]|nr:tetratricopeptide repeat protein [Candidatus Omnitrophota bacterium]